MKYASIGIYVCDMFIRKIINAVIKNQFQGFRFPAVVAEIISQFCILVLIFALTCTTLQVFLDILVYFQNVKLPKISHLKSNGSITCTTSPASTDSCLLSPGHAIPQKPASSQFSSVSKDVAPSHWLPLSCLAQLMYLSTRVNSNRKLFAEVKSSFITKRSEDAEKPSFLCDYL